MVVPKKREERDTTEVERLTLSRCDNRGLLAEFMNVRPEVQIHLSPLYSLCNTIRMLKAVQDVRAIGERIQDHLMHTKCRPRRDTLG